MSLADALEANKTSARGPRCTLCVLLTKMDKADRVALDAALADDTFTHAAISRALKAEGYGITANTVQRHRTRGCAYPL